MIGSGRLQRCVLGMLVAVVLGYGGYVWASQGLGSRDSVGSTAVNRAENGQTESGRSGKEKISPSCVEREQSVSSVDTAAVTPASVPASKTKAVAEVKKKPAAAGRVTEEKNVSDVPVRKEADGMGASGRIVASLQKKGTPVGNYKVSEVDSDIVLDAAAYTSGPDTSQKINGKAVTKSSGTRR